MIAENRNRSRRRVVITGMGAVTPLGNTAQDFWRAAVAGNSGAAPITRFDASAYPTRFACEVKGFDPLDYMEKKQTNRMDRFAQFALAVARQALQDAGIEPASLPAATRERFGVVFGSGQGGLSTFQEQTRILIERGPGRLSPFFVPMMIPDMAAGLISIEYGLSGPNHCLVSACATGNDNIAHAVSIIREGKSDIMIAGSSEAPICEVGVGGFAAARALSTRNDEPTKASRPFDLARDGFVIGEGAGAFVLEELQHALARGARIYAEVLGYGASADAYHMTAPHPEGLGARLSMQRALDEAGLQPSDIDSINMHGTSTQLGDIAECGAVRQAFGSAADKIVATSTKSMTGHLLGAAGAVEAIATVYSIVDNVVPPTINVDEQDPSCDLPVAANAAVTRRVDVAMSNAFGFGGHNTTVVLGRYAG